MMLKCSWDVNDVVFPYGWVIVNDELCIYYGSTDTSESMASAKMRYIMEFIRGFPEIQFPEECYRWFEGNRGKSTDPKKGYV